LKKQAQVTKEVRKKTTSNTDSGKASGLLSYDPFIGKAVAFGMQSNFGLKLSCDLKDTFCPEAICYHLDKKHGHIVARKANPINYDVVWEFTTLGESQVSYAYLLDGNKEAERLMRRRLSLNRHRRAGLHTASRSTEVGDPGIDMSDEEVHMEAPCSEDNLSTSTSESFDFGGRQEWDILENTESNMSGILPPWNGEVLEQELQQEIGNTAGLHWECNTSIGNEPNNKPRPRGASVKASCAELFDTPMNSVMAIFPAEFWTTIVQEVNRYAHQTLRKQGRRPRLVRGYKWRDVSMPEILTFMGMLMYGMLYPQTGRRMIEWWDSPYKNAWTKFMSKGRFQQISSMLHFNNNEDVDGSNSDSLHKVRPILAILKCTISQYATYGTEFSFDEATMACRSSYGRHLIVYNGMKPTGKFHFKIYMLCCAITNLVHKIKIHTRNNSDADEVDSDENAESEINKIDTLTLEMCRPIYGTWSTVNMDNYYMLATCAMHLRQKGVYCRGTIRSSRKFIPKSILYSSAEVKSLPRGAHRYAVNTEHGLVAVGWIDNKAVHFISTADSTKVVNVRRRVQNNKVDVSAPIIVQNYNKYMGGVDRHDRL